MRLFHIACLLQAYQALADLPVHCLVDDVAGSWEFALGPSTAHRGSCGHRRPDDPMHEPLVAEGPRDSPLYSKLAVELLPGGAARVGDQQGSWRMVSDEAVEVTGGNVELLAFLGFEQLPADNGGDHLPLSLQRRHSRCGETVLGWYNKDNRAEWGCWYGRRAAGSFLQLGAAGGARIQRHLRQAFPGERGIDDVDVGGWDLPGLSLSTWSSDVVKRRSPVTDGIDWRNVSGSSWVDAPLVQGHCGSCYAAAAVQMLSARHRISSGDPSFEGFSVSFPLYCGEYTEGCRGGYPFLAAKWSQDVGLVPESCAPYAAEGSCGLKCTQEQLSSKGRYRATGHRYVTGGEDSIIEELKRGPVAVSFRSEVELQDYTGGVWEPPPLDDEAREGGFVAPTHSSLLVGYGVDTSSGESVPYWRLQNTWGSAWGENGTFRIRRDLARERGIETLVVAADVVQEDRPAIVDELLESVQPTAGEVLISVSASREAVRGHRGEPVCREEPSGPGDEAVVVRLDREHNFRGLSFGDSAGTETAVQCAGATPDTCTTVPAGQPIPPCSEVETCPCDLHGRPLPYPGMQALAEPVVNMCSSSSGAARVLLIGLGGGAISSYLFDRCPAGRLILENVEKDGRVAGLASKFFGFAEGSANTIQVTDGLSAVQSKDKGQYDAIMVDCFAGKDRVPLGCRSEEFYRSARALLKAEGLLLQNVWGRSSASEEVASDFNATVDALGAAFQRAPSKEVVFDAPQSLEYILYGLQGTQWSSLLPVDGSM